MKHLLVLLCCLLLASCSISHKTVYLQAWENKPHLTGQYKSYLIRIALPSKYKLRSISGAEFNVEYGYFDGSDSSAVFVSNIEPGLETLFHQYNELSKHEYSISDRYFTEFRYRHIRYGYRNISYKDKDIMDALMNKVQIDSMTTKVNKGGVYQRKLEHHVYRGARRSL